MPSRAALNAYLKQRCEDDILFFAAYCFPHYVTDAIPEFHKETFAALEDRQNTLIISPRGHSKSTNVSLIKVVHVVLKREVHFPVIFSETDDQAKALLFAIRDELSKNERIIALWGNIIESENEKKIITTTGICLRCAGRGSSTRGWRFKQYRPDLIIADDLEDEESVSTKLQRDKVERWWNSSVVPMQGPTCQTVIVGTTLHKDALLLRKKHTGSYRVIEHRAVLSWAHNTDLWDEWNRIFSSEGEAAADAFYAKNEAAMLKGAEVLWPRMRPYVWLMKKRREIGSFAFETEYQNSPIPNEERIIQPEWVDTVEVRIREPDESYILDGGERILLNDLTKYGAVDPAISKSENADFSVICTIGRHLDGRTYLLEIERKHLNTLELVDAIAQSFEKWGHTKIVIETVAYQESLKQLVEEYSKQHGMGIPVEGVKPDRDKVRRLRRWQPTFQQGLVKASDAIPSSVMDELFEFPRGEHDDVVDGITYALEAASSASSGRLRLEFL